MEVLNNTVTVLADAAERSDEIDEERAQTAMQRAQERLTQRGADLELERVAASMRRAQIRLNVVRRRRARADMRGTIGGGGPAGG